VSQCQPRASILKNRLMIGEALDTEQKEPGRRSRSVMSFYLEALTEELNLHGAEADHHPSLYKGKSITGNEKAVIMPVVRRGRMAGF
jgi:hypothetical protein